MQGDGPRRCLDQMDFLITHLDDNMVSNYLVAFDRAVYSGDSVGRDLARAELLKYFRILPDKYTSQCATSDYYSRVIGFIRNAETANGELSNEMCFQLALCHMTLGDSLRAFHYLSRMEGAEMTEDLAFLSGFMAFSVGRFQRALSLFTISAESEDELIRYDSIFGCAAVQTVEGNYGQALVQWEKLLEMKHPVITVKDIRFHIAVVRFMNREEEVGARALGELNCMDGLHQRVYLEAVRERWQSALEMCAHVPITEQSFDMRVLVAYLKYRVGKFHQAQMVVQTLVQGHKEPNFNVLYLWGMSRFRGESHPENRVMDVIQSLMHVDMMRPENMWIEQNLAAAYEMGKRYDLAEGVYRAMIDGDRLRNYASFRLARVTAARSNRPGDLGRIPELEDPPVEALCENPAFLKIEEFRTGMLLASPRLMAFLGDVEPEITETHKMVSFFYRDRCDDPGEVEVCHTSGM